MTTNDTILKDLYQRLQQRKRADPSASYVASLYLKGRDKILGKVSEELFELAMATKNGSLPDVVDESADLLFHLWVLLADLDIDPGDVLAELVARFNTRAAPVPMQGHPLRLHERHAYQQQLVLQMDTGLIVRGTTHNISLDGILLQTDFEPKWQILGESGFFEIKVRNEIDPTTVVSDSKAIRVEVTAPRLYQHFSGQVPHNFQEYRFNFEVARTTSTSIGLRITDNHGLFAFALSNDVFRDLFDQDVATDTGHGE
ncbi:MAG: phosphoribosyl-ATP diphosphatase [Magnetococcales bacterium]|nr:phosphoribosyl-ATP diphosphatase [Magnetococcales bacterium]